MPEIGFQRDIAAVPTLKDTFYKGNQPHSGANPHHHRLEVHCFAEAARPALQNQDIVIFYDHTPHRSLIPFPFFSFANRANFMLVLENGSAAPRNKCRTRVRIMASSSAAPFWRDFTTQI